ncbi:MAG: response regulator [Proteobacteria bacterium]|nr:response regulator [Pseudomonadota bacterium]
MTTHYWLSDKEGRLLENDEALGELLGYSLPQLHALAVTDLEVGLVLQPTAAVWQRQAVYRKSDGSLVKANCCTRYTPDKGGQYFTFLQKESSPPTLPAPSDHSAMLHLILESQLSKIVLFNLQFEVLWLNKSACLSCGRNMSELLGKKCNEIWPECSDRSCENCPVDRAIALNKVEQRKMAMPNNRRWRVTTIPIQDDTGKLQSVLYIGDDITEYLTIDKEARQSHKIESLGTLAGGIAHDFNNILSGIVGYTELSLAIVKEEGTLREYLLELSQAGKRATALVRQILTFTRRGEGKLVSTEIPVIIKEVLQLLRSTLPSTIDLKKKIDNSVNPVVADPVQIHQIIMNLCTNASHAMEPYGGVLTVTISKATLAPQFFERNRELMPGEYLQLSVGDTGCGMSQEVVASIFDPYFTTKPVGQGTGLGLSVVHGIVKDCGGHIMVDSVEGQGSTFTIYLPTVERSASYDEVAVISAKLRGTETILVVDDEPVILDVTRTYLQIQGYTVQTEKNSQVALNRFRDNPQGIDMLISDVTMPHLTGDRLARECLAVRPNLPIILMTGYTDLVSDQGLRELGVRALIMKPVVGMAFLAKIRRLLDEAKETNQ